MDGGEEEFIQCILGTEPTSKQQMNVALLLFLANPHEWRSIECSDQQEPPQLPHYTRQNFASKRNTTSRLGVSI